MAETTAWQFMKAFSRNMSLGMHSGVTACSIPVRQFMMMAFVAEHMPENDDGITVSEIARRFNVSKPAISQMINSIEEKGYIQRVAHGGDRRLVKVAITEEGKKQLIEVRNQHLDYIEKVLNAFGEENTKQLISLLELFYETAQKQQTARK